MHTPAGTGCSCRLGRTCESAGKHPRTPHGFKDATTDLGTIDGWWAKWPEANVAIRTGNGLVVVDIDGSAGERQAAQVDLPTTVEATTGNGRHLYYAGDAPSPTGLLKGIDIRGNGACVVAPPSVHASGTRYQWVNSPEMRDLAPLPGWISDLIVNRKTIRGEGEVVRHAARVEQARSLERHQIGEGERNNELFRFACSLSSIGVHQHEIAAALEARNHDCCNPPLAGTEIAGIAESAARRSGVYLSDAALLQNRMTPHTLAVYLAIRARADHQGVCIAGYEALAEDANVGISRVKSRAIRELEALGLVSVKRPGPLKLNRPRLANVYTLLDPEEQSTAPAGAVGTKQGDNDHDDRR
jgi:hypothetical protein